MSLLQIAKTSFFTLIVGIGILLSGCTWSGAGSASEAEPTGNRRSVIDIYSR